MPTITNPGVIQELVAFYLANGLDKGIAGLSVGYSESYVKNGDCAKLWNRQDVQVELRKQRLELARKTGFTKEQASVDLDEDRQLARILKQPSAAISATSAKIRLYGMDQTAGSDQTIIIISPPVPTNSPKRVESEVIENEDV